MVVVLPAPLGPSRLKISPSGMAKRDAVDGQHALGRVELLAQLLDLDDAHRPTLLVGVSAEPRYTPGNRPWSRFLSLELSLGESRASGRGAGEGRTRHPRPPLGGR